MARVIIEVDPYKRSATIEVINEREQTIGQGRFGTDTDGYKAMLAAGRRHKDRAWAVKGCNGIGRHVAQRLVADSETVVDVLVVIDKKIKVAKQETHRTRRRHRQPAARVARHRTLRRRPVARRRR